MIRTEKEMLVVVPESESEKEHLCAASPVLDDVCAHEALQHAAAWRHHHHTHAAVSHHIAGHHLLQVEDLSIGFTLYDPDDARFFSAAQKKVRVIDNLSISVHAGEIVAVVGASGSGKTLLADAIMGLFAPNATVFGRIWFDGVLQSAQTLAQVRGRGISLVPQSINYLDPLMKVGRQVRGFVGDDAARKAHCRKLFERYDLDEGVLDLYPFELSGGMARRVLLICALMDDPQLIIADEPTPGLDLNLAIKALDDFRAFADEGKGVLLITHDIELALRVADRVAVFKDGTVVEETAVANFAAPHLLQHPFSRELWHALPEHDFAQNAEEDFSC
ncbi:MAG: ATP-binding cassette domain-containing protein [Raoultibacter sp.]